MKTYVVPTHKRPMTYIISPLVGFVFMYILVWYMSTIRGHNPYYSMNATELEQFIKQNNKSWENFATWLEDHEPTLKQVMNDEPYGNPYNKPCDLNLYEELNVRQLWMDILGSTLDEYEIEKRHNETILQLFAKAFEDKGNLKEMEKLASVCLTGMYFECRASSDGGGDTGTEEPEEESSTEDEEPEEESSTENDEEDYPEEDDLETSTTRTTSTSTESSIEKDAVTGGNLLAQRAAGAGGATCQCMRSPFQTKYERGICRMMKWEPCTRHRRTLNSQERADYPAFCSTGNYCKHRDGRYCADLKTDPTYIWAGRLINTYKRLPFEPRW